MIGFLRVRQQLSGLSETRIVWVNPEAIDQFQDISDMERRGNLFLSMRNGTTLYLAETEEEFLVLLERVSSPPPVKTPGRCGAVHPDGNLRCLLNGHTGAHANGEVIW